jgi:hypothetical protein
MLGVHRVGGDGMVMMAEQENQGDLSSEVTEVRSQSVHTSDESR